MPSLHEYRRKRHFDRTPEPAGRKKPGKGFSFVIQKHAARRLHYDFRLELDGVLLSWAVPKGPSLDPSVKRLATQTEDHPIDYGGFEGTIPKGEYGGGTVLVWDRGTWEPEGDARQGYDKGHLAFILHGEKLQGRWHLVRTRDPKGRAWILFKSKDSASRPVNGQADIVDEAPDSVLSGRSLEQIAAGPDRVWHSKKTDKPDATLPDVSTLSGARRARLPKFVKPVLAVAVPRVPEGDDWVHEIQLDGARVLARLEDGHAELLTTEGKKYSARVPSVIRTLEAFRVDSALIDGEVVILDQSGVSDAAALKRSLVEKREDAILYYAFDLLHLNGFDLTRVPLVERKEALRGLLASMRALEGRLRFADHLRGNGEHFYEQAEKLHVPGVVSKRVGAPYALGRKNWVRVKCARPRASKPRELKRARAAAVSNASRILYPEQCITKQELGDYYLKVAEWMLPHLENRLLTLVRCPEGYHKECFYQKHARPGMSDAIMRVA